MAHGNEGCTRVKEDENVEGSSVSTGEEIIEYFEEGSFCTVELANPDRKGSNGLLECRCVWSCEATRHPRLNERKGRWRLADR